VEAAVTRVRWRPLAAAAVAVHVLLVALISAGYALLSFSAEEPNIGAGALLLSLLVLGFPWFSLPWLARHVEPDVALLAASAFNVVLHLSVAAGLSRWRPHAVRPLAATPRARRLAAAVALAVAVVLVVVVVGAAVVLRTASRSAQSQDALRAELTALLPREVWAAGALELPSRCTFCDPQSLGARATRLVVQDQAEPVLLAAVDERFRSRGYTPDAAWSCQSRQCFRAFTGANFSGMARIRAHKDSDTQLWLDVFPRRPS